MLREKEKGDWKKLSKEEKKILYRASFCQTLVETETTDGEWKMVLAMTLFGISVGVWGYMLMAKFGKKDIDTKGPSTHDEEKILRRAFVKYSSAKSFYYYLFLSFFLRNSNFHKFFRLVGLFRKFLYF